MKNKRHKPASRQVQNQLRIIGGNWRGRKLSFPSLEGLRPTPDRVRETLFNWLAAATPGARCLDLFAGSGALGLEALSRGATSAQFIDNASAVCQQLKDNLKQLDCDHAEVSNQTALTWLQSNHPQPFDIIFLDPPFHQNLLQDCINQIDQQNLLSETGWVYLEMNNQETLPVLPPTWQLHREKQAGQISYRLFTCHGGR